MNISNLIDKLPIVKQEINNLDDNFAINTILEDLIIDISHAQFASIWIHHFPNLTRYRKDNIGLLSMESKEGLMYECFALNKENIYNYIRSEKGYVESIDNPDKIKIKSKIIIPLMENNHCIGIVTAYSDISKIKKFSKKDVEIFQAISPFLIESINKMKFNDRVKNDKNFVDRRSKNNVDNKKRRRKEDAISNLQVIKKDRDKTSLNDCSHMVEFTSNIVHDIRTPSNGLYGFLDILEEQIDDHRLKAYISNAKKSALLINELTSSILDSISNESVAKSQKKTFVHSAGFFANIADIFSANLYKKQIVYDIFIDPLIPEEIEIDEMKLQRVIINLIGNASKFTPEYGTIKFYLRYEKEKNAIHISIQDNGIGIAKDKQEEIFEAFKQAEENTKDNYGGTGLGLSICASYVKEMGGKLLVSSILEQGSNFYFDLPLSETLAYQPLFPVIEESNLVIYILLDKDDIVIANNMMAYLKVIGLKECNIKVINTLSKIELSTEHIIAFESKMNSELLSLTQKHHINLLVIEKNFLELKSMDNEKIISPYNYMGDDLYRFVSIERMKKVLIVEDDHITISLLKAMLENEYCKIDIANDGQEGLDKLEQALENKKPYDMVYTDQNMPNLSGKEMIRIYKELETKSNFKIKSISISGSTYKKEEEKYFDYFAKKPFTKEEVLRLFKK